MRTKLLVSALVVEITSAVAVLLGGYLQFSSGKFPASLGMVGAAGVAFGSIIWAKFYDGETVMELLADGVEEENEIEELEQDIPPEDTLAFVRNTSRQLVEELGELDHIDETVPIYRHMDEEEDEQREFVVQQRLGVEY